MDTKKLTPDTSQMILEASRKLRENVQKTITDPTIQAATQLLINDILTQELQPRLQAVVESATSSGKSSLNSIWRPLTAIALVALNGVAFVASALGHPVPGADQLLTAMEIFTGIYAGGRSVEKIAGMMGNGKSK